MPDITDPAVRKEERIDAATLRVTRRSTFTDAIHTVDLPITHAEWQTYCSSSALIQDALPSLSNAQREFLMTGATQAEWDSVFAADEDEQ